MEPLSDIEADKDVSATVEHHDSSGGGGLGREEGAVYLPLFIFPTPKT